MNEKKIICGPCHCQSQIPQIENLYFSATKNLQGAEIVYDLGNLKNFSH